MRTIELLFVPSNGNHLEGKEKKNRGKNEMFFIKVSLLAHCIGRRVQSEEIY